jgi:hypothetical protein
LSDELRLIRFLRIFHFLGGLDTAPGLDLSLLRPKLEAKAEGSNPWLATSPVSGPALGQIPAEGNSSFGPERVKSLRLGFKTVVGHGREE